jgi:hypothetical protein
MKLIKASKKAKPPGSLIYSYIWTLLLSLFKVIKEEIRGVYPQKVIIGDKRPPLLLERL